MPVEELLVGFRRLRVLLRSFSTLSLNNSQECVWLSESWLPT